MNPTKIEWASLNMPGGGFTWNPIVGCTNGCPYCYARATAPSVARRVAAVRGTEPCQDCLTFTPHLHKERLWQPCSRRIPSGVFVGSMCDLWDPCVNPEWRGSVRACEEFAPQHNYAYLTKRPDLMDCIESRDYGRGNLALGVSIDRPNDLWRIAALSGIKPNIAFASFEPLQERIQAGSLVDNELRCLDWAIIGAETGRRQGRIGPRMEWVVELVDACDAAGVPVFLKDNLRQCIGVDAWFRSLRQEWPEAWA